MTKEAFAVETNVAFVETRGRKGLIESRLKDMDIGDSFHIEPTHRIVTIRSNISTWGKRHGRKFKVHLDLDEGGWRCWRIV